MSELFTKIVGLLLLSTVHDIEDKNVGECT